MTQEQEGLKSELVPRHVLEFGFISRQAGLNPNSKP